VWHNGGNEPVSSMILLRHQAAHHYIYAFHSYGAMLVVPSYISFTCGTARGYQEKNGLKGSITRLDSLVRRSLQQWAGSSDTPL
jgi:hypothetical protein